MMYEFGVTPDTFDRANFDSIPENKSNVVQFLRGVVENGIIADLDKGKWVTDVEQARLQPHEQSVRARILALLQTLKDRNRLVRHPKASNVPACDDDWLKLVQQSDVQTSFFELILGDVFFETKTFTDARYEKLSRVLESNLWLSRRRTMDLLRDEPNYRAVFTPVLRHAKTLDLIDKFINPRDQKWTKPIDLFSELAGKRFNDRINVRVRIHTDEGEQTRTGRPVADCLDDWRQFLSPLNSRYGHSFEVIFWRVKPGGEPFHDRQLITNQCGIEVPAGLELPNRAKPGTTTISLVDEDVRRAKLAKFSSPTNVYETRPEWLIKIG